MAAIQETIIYKWTSRLSGEQDTIDVLKKDKNERQHSETKGLGISLEISSHNYDTVDDIERLGKWLIDQAAYIKSKYNEDGTRNKLPQSNKTAPSLPSEQRNG